MSKTRSTSTSKPTEPRADGKPFPPPLPPQRKLLAVMSFLFGAWVIFLLTLYVTTILMAPG